MYLTKLLLDPSCTQVRRDLGDSYELHRTLVRAFVNGPGDKAPRFLWRLEQFEYLPMEPTVLVQSEIKGNWSVLERLPGYLLRSTQTKLVNLDSFITAGYSYRFRLMANPTVTRGRKRYGLSRRSDLDEWLHRQGERHGFAVRQHLVVSRRLFRSSQKITSTICLYQVCFEGLLLVRDKNEIRNAVLAGLGPGKAFGCGLLSLAPCLDTEEECETVAYNQYSGALAEPCGSAM